MASQTLESLQAVVAAAIVLLTIEDDVRGLGPQASKALHLLGEATSTNRCVICGEENCLRYP